MPSCVQLKFWGWEYVEQLSSLRGQIFDTLQTALGIQSGTSPSMYIYSLLRIMHKHSGILKQASGENAQAIH